MPKKTAGVHALSGGARAKKSIDYAVMEATNLAALAPTDLGWSASADLIVCAASPANEGSLVDLIVSLDPIQQAQHASWHEGGKYF
jgi:hypothetical protein